MPDIKQAGEADEKKQQIWDKGQEQLAQLTAAHARVERKLAEKIEFYKPGMEGLEKWLLATLVVVNGGAAIALLGNDSGHFVRLRMPLAIFVAGVVCSLLSGLLTREGWAFALSAHDRSIAAHESLEKMGKIRDYRDFLEQSQDIQIEFRAIKLKGEKEVQIMKVLAMSSTAAFYGSLACFILGCIAAGILIA